MIEVRSLIQIGDVKTILVLIEPFQCSVCFEPAANVQ